MNTDSSDSADFVLREKHMTVLFPSAEEGAVVARLGAEGIDLGTARIDPPLSAPTAPEIPHMGDAEKAMEEVADVVFESFSDDEKLSHRIQRMREAGQAAISFSFDGDETRRRELAQRLEDAGATAVFFWGSWVTEQL